MPSAKLTNRGVISLYGPEAKSFLQGLVTTDMAKISQTQAGFGALLSPQGKIIADFFIIGTEDGFLLDVAKDQCAGLIKKLNLYRLRAKVVVLDVSAQWAVAAFWGDDTDVALPLWADPRLPALGYRTIVHPDALSALSGSEHAYAQHCLRCGVPSGGVDFAFGEVFPHEANMDVLHGLAFDKGCYIGQEIVARVEHRGTARKRFVRINFAGEELPHGTQISAGDQIIGTISSTHNGQGLALLRIDHAREAEAQGRPLLALTSPTPCPLTYTLLT